MRERALIIQLLNLKSVPDYAFITNAVEHENNTLKDMRLKKGGTVTFDLGYCNYKTFGNFCEHGVLFVTRLKENATYEVVEVRETDCEQVPSDETIIFFRYTDEEKMPAPAAEDYIDR